MRWRLGPGRWRGCQLKEHLRLPQVATATSIGRPAKADLVDLAACNTLASRTAGVYAAVLHSYGVHWAVLDPQFHARIDAPHCIDYAAPPRLVPGGAHGSPKRRRRVESCQGPGGPGLGRVAARPRPRRVGPDLGAARDRDEGRSRHRTAGPVLRIRGEEIAKGARPVHCW